MRRYRLRTTSKRSPQSRFSAESATRFAVAAFVLLLGSAGCADRSNDQKSKRSTDDTTASSSPVDSTTAASDSARFLVVADGGASPLAVIDGGGEVIERLDGPEAAVAPRPVRVAVDMCPGYSRWIERWENSLVVRDASDFSIVETIEFTSAGISASGTISCLDDAANRWVRGDENIYNVIESITYGERSGTGWTTRSVSGDWTDVVAAGEFAYAVSKAHALGDHPRLQVVSLASDPLNAVNWAYTPPEHLAPDAPSESPAVAVAVAADVSGESVAVAAIEPGRIDSGSTIHVLAAADTKAILSVSTTDVVDALSFMSPETLRIVTATTVLDVDLRDAPAATSRSPEPVAVEVDTESSWATTASADAFCGIVDGGVTVGDRARSVRVRPFDDDAKATACLGFSRRGK